MAPKPDSDGGDNGQVLVITRIFQASRAEVFAAWTDPSRFSQWMAPRNFTATSCEADVRQGGKWRMRMKPAQGPDLWVGGTYHNVVLNERLEFTFEWEQPVDGQTKATSVTVLFEDDNGGTRLTLRQSGFDSAKSRDSHVKGWSESFDKLTSRFDRLPR